MKFECGLGALALVATLLAGCSRDDGTKDFAAGMQAWEAGDWATAMTALEKSTRICPTNTAAWVYLALANIELGNPKAADFAVKKAEELDSSSPEIMVCDARVAFLLKDYERASDKWTLVANDLSVPGELRAKAYADLGGLAIVENDPDMARLALFRGLRVNRKEPLVWYYLGRLYRDSFRFDREALESFEMFVHLAPNVDENVQRVKDKVLPDLRASLAQETAELANSGANRDSAKAAVLLQEGSKLAAQNKLSLALKKYGEGLKADPLSAPVALAAAETAERLANGPQTYISALNAWKTAAALSPNSKAVYTRAAAMALKAGRWSEANALLSRALARQPANPEILDMVITSYRKCGQGKVADAYQAYRRSLAK